MSLRLTICGSAGSHTGPGRACSGYLLETASTRVLLDCGNGSTANLQKHTSFHDLDAVVITHRHVDHCADLIGMFYALRFGPAGRGAVDLFAAPEVLPLVTGLLTGDSAMEFREVFRCVEVVPGDRFAVGDIEMTTFPSAHPPPTFSVRAATADGTVAYSSDSAGGPDLVAAATDVDLFLCEATWPGDIADYPSGLHMTPAVAAEVARAAGVNRLVLTHLIGSADRERFRREAAAVFDGPLSLADDGDVYEIP